MKSPVISLTSRVLALAFSVQLFGIATVHAQPLNCPVCTVSAEDQAILNTFMGKVFVLNTDHLYRAGAENEVSGLIAIFDHPTAVVKSITRQTNGYWRAMIRTSTGEEGYVEVSHLYHLSHFLSSTNESGTLLTDISL